MSAIFGFTFHIGRMTEVLTPDIYRAHCTNVTVRHQRMSKKCGISTRYHTLE